MYLKCGHAKLKSYELIMESGTGSHLNSELTLRWELALLKLKRDVENKVYTFEESYDSAEKMRLDFMNNGVVPTSKIVNIHVQLCGRISAAMQVIDIYMSENVECSIYAFNSAITLAGNIARASCYFMALRKQQLYSSIKLVAEQTTRNSTDENLDIIFETLFFFNVVPNIVTINVLLNIASNDTEIGKIFACGAKLRLAPLLITFNIMIARAESFNFALAYFRELKMYRYIPDIITLTTLLKKTESLKQVKMTEQLLRAEKTETNYDWQKQMANKKSLFTSIQN